MVRVVRGGAAGDTVEEATLQDREAFAPTKPRTIDEKTGHAENVVCLVPYRPETNAWKVLVRSASAIFVLEDRLRFDGRSYVSLSVSAIVVWGGSPDTLADLGTYLPRDHRVMRAQIVHGHGNALIAMLN